MTKAITRCVPADFKSLIRAEAQQLGFDATRFTKPEAIGSAGERLRHFLALGRHGGMDWMEQHASRRTDPRVLMPEVSTVLMLGISYAPDTDPLAVLNEKSRGAISVYAKGRDYHDVIKKKLKSLARLIQTHSAADVKVFVDTAPLMEKPLAAAAGVGWQGKHTNLVSRTHGSWLFLGAILTSAAIEPDAAEEDHCGSCRRCLDVCPTDAFPAPYQLDARRCIAYLTIEHKGHIDREFRAPIGNRVFGCDDCLAVCPWNKFAERARDMRFAARADTDDPPLNELLSLDEPAFRLRFAGTPVKRTGRDRFVRNCLIAAGNSGDARLLPGVRARLRDVSPLVRAMAVWAVRRLCDEGTVTRLQAQHLPDEADAEVRNEWLYVEVA